MPEMAHDWQLGHGLLTQQNPSVQLPLSHSTSVTQASPFDFTEPHEPERHENPGAQSASPVHAVKHATAPHR